ncbi:MAG: sodium:solute symporter family transporter, partial [Infirmifilum sp.]
MEEKILASWIGIALYMILVIYVGVKYYAKIKSISDFVVAGRSLGFWVAWGTILATWFCSGTSLGGAQMTYLFGMRGVIMDPIASALAVIFFGLFFVAKLRKLKYITVADFFRYRYGPEMEIASAIVQILGYIGWLGGMLLAYSIVFQILLGWEREPGLYLATIITIIYTTLGGMFAVALLDFIRVFIFWVAMW